MVNYVSRRSEEIQLKGFISPRFYRPWHYY